MNGKAVTLYVGDIYTDAGATCTDDVDAICDVITDDTVNTTIAGTYSVTYTAIDSTGNTATPVVRTVTVKPAPIQAQGVITSVGQRQVIINNQVITHDGDTTIQYNSGLTALAVGQMAYYTYTVDVDGVILASTMDIYPTQTVSGTERVSTINVNNATSIVSLTLYKGSYIDSLFNLHTGLVVDFYQASGIYVYDAGTNTSYGNQLVTYTGFVDPTT